MSDDALLPCPKCGSTNLDRDTHLGPFPIPAVLCIDCGWGEPSDRWNERATRVMAPQGTGLNTIQDVWEAYEREVVPAGAGPVQRQETRRAFYGGAAGVLGLTVALTEMGDDAAVQALETLHEECRSFVDHETGGG